MYATTRPSYYLLVLAFAFLNTSLHLALAASEKESAVTEGNSPISDTKNAISGTRITQNFEIYNPHSREQLQAVKEMGFTQVILDWPNLHPMASELGLNVVMANWWTEKSEIEQIEKGMETALQVDRNRLAAVSMMDEPERYAPDTPFSFYQALYKDLRANLDQERPHAKLEISHWGPLRSWPAEAYDAFVSLYQATDRIRLMPYPDLGEGPLSEVYLQMLRSKRIMKLANRQIPQVVILQTWVLPEDPKLPTIDELRVMSYLALLGGVHTVSYFNYDPTVWDKTPGFADGFKSLMRELTEFARRHQSAAVDSELMPNGLFEATLRATDGSTIGLLINTNRSETDGHAALSIAETGRTPPSIPALIGLGQPGAPTFCAVDQSPSTMTCTVPCRSHMASRGPMFGSLGLRSWARARVARLRYCR